MVGDYRSYLRKLPKVELHCHVEGTLRPATVVELAGKHGIRLPTTEVDQIYRYDTIYEFLEIYKTVNSTVRNREDFARMAYETLEDGVRLGNLKYREMFFNPTLHTARGIPMATVMDGLVDGIRAAEHDLGVRCALIADVYRQDPPEVARRMVEEVLEHRRPELVGLGMDAAEAPDPPEKFVEAYRVAKAGGLRLTSHCAEDGPAANVTTCLDLLGCVRLDHGYHALEDPAVVARCIDQGVTFTVCPTSTAMVYGWPDLTTHPITRMIEAGMSVMLNSDDPTMFHTDIGNEYAEFCAQNDYPPELVRRLVMQGVEAAWLDESDKAAMRRAFQAEIDELDRDFGI